jgi:FkbM family methyltransferase
LVEFDFDAYLKEPLAFAPEASKYYSSADQLVIFEVGACEGEDTIKLSRQYTNSIIYAFEPLPKNVKRMRSNYKKYGAHGIRVNQLAMSDKNGSAVFYVSSGQPDNIARQKNWDFGNKSSSLLPPKEHKKILDWVKFNEKIKVKTSQLDTFCQNNGIDKIDLLYLDVQGAELKVLKGAGEFLNKIGMIWLEVEAIELYKGQPLKDDVESFMYKNNFIKIIDTVDKVSGDQLYVNKSLKKRGGLLPGVLNRIKGGSV